LFIKYIFIIEILQYLKLLFLNDDMEELNVNLTGFKKSFNL